MRRNETLDRPRLYPDLSAVPVMGEMLHGYSVVRVSLGDDRKVPYEPAPVEPTKTRFWKAVSEILSTAVRLDPPKGMDPMDEPEGEVESLFEAVVQPTLSRRVRV